MTTPFHALLRAYEACPEALEWVGDRTPQEAWSACPRGSWLVWYAFKAGYSPKTIRWVVEACLWNVIYPSYRRGSWFSFEGMKDAVEYMKDPSKAHWALDRATRVCWDSDVAENHDADDDKSYSGSRAALQARFADIIRKHIPEVP